MLVVVSGRIRVRNPAQVPGGASAYRCGIRGVALPSPNDGTTVQAESRLQRLGLSGMLEASR